MGINSQKMNLMIRVAQMYYNSGISQKDIAAQLSLSRGYVCRLLDQARDVGIVEIKVKSLREESELERHFCELFGLSKAIVVPSDGQNEEESLNTEMITEACNYIDSILENGMTIAFSWGRTIFQVSRQMAHHAKVRDITAVPCCGGTSNLNNRIYVAETSQNIAGAYNGTPLSIPLPAVLETEALKKAVCGDANMKTILDRISRADVALFTVGEFGERNSIYLGGYIDREQIMELQKKGAVGDLCAHFIREDGTVCDPQLDSRTVSVSLCDFGKIRNKICVAAGEQKARALLGVLRRKYVDVLITDEYTAHTLLRLQ